MSCSTVMSFAATTGWDWLLLNIVMSSGSVSGAVLSVLLRSSMVAFCRVCVFSSAIVVGAGCVCAWKVRLCAVLSRRTCPVGT